MKKVFFSLVTLVVMSFSVSSCKKCVVCTFPAVGGVTAPATEYCEGGTAKTAFENACKSAGGTVSDK